MFGLRPVEKVKGQDGDEGLCGEEAEDLFTGSVRTPVCGACEFTVENGERIEGLEC